jgi:anti-sigma-K factor RskA
MIHLTTKQVLQFVDGTLDYASQAQCTNHLAVCGQCRREVEFQKTLAKVSRRQPTVQPSGQFAARVMGKIIPQNRKTWANTVLDNLGNVFAMFVVLTVVGYAIANPSLFTSQDQSSQPSVLSQTIAGTYSKIVQSFTERTKDATQTVVSTSGNDSSKVISMTIMTFLFLIVLDQFVLKRYTGIRTKR